jgi:hypothetical protein
MKTWVLAVLLIAVALAIAYFVFSKTAYPLTQQDAERFFLEDLQQKYPNADVREVINITQATGADGSPSFQLEARVTSGLSTPCPERIHVWYDYPPKNYVSQPPEYITRGCQICINEQVCIIAFPEEAVIASHTYPGTEEVASFVSANADAKADPVFMDSYGNYSNVWVVKWSAPSSNYTFSVVLSKDLNKVLEVLHA